MLEDVKFNVEGLRELEDMLLKLAPKEAKKALRAGLVEGSKPFRKRAKVLAPRMSADPKKNKGVTNREPGWLADSIRFEAKYDRKYSIVARVGEHSRLPREKVAADRQGRKGVVWGQIVEFGGKGRQTPQPFMRPAWEQTHSQVLSQFRIKFRKILFKKLRA